MNPGGMSDPGTRCDVYAILCIVALNSVVLVDFVGEGGVPTDATVNSTMGTPVNAPRRIANNSEKPRNMLCGDMPIRACPLCMFGALDEDTCGVYVYCGDLLHWPE
jgi:hypothetical protein